MSLGENTYEKDLIALLKHQSQQQSVIYQSQIRKLVCPKEVQRLVPPLWHYTYSLNFEQVFFVCFLSTTGEQVVALYGMESNEPKDVYCSWAKSAGKLRIGERVHFTEMTVQNQEPYMIAITMTEEGLRVHELRAGKEVEAVAFPQEVEASKEVPIDFMVLKTVKRNSDTSVYIAILTSWSIQVCELLLSQPTMQYKVIHIKEIILSVKLYPEKTKWIELPAANME